MRQHPMLMITSEFPRQVRARLYRLFDALVDPARSERNMALMLASYLAAWSLYAAIAKSSQDIHPDMGEMVAWSREAGFGLPKHPPLAAWLVHAWFSIFPRADWSYYLFAMVLPTLALWITWRISARHLPRDKRVASVALLTLVPFYNFHALKYNANAVLTPFWAATTWWFLRSFETRRAGWAVLAGIGAAAAMLGKYWSVVLLAGLGLAALTDSRRDKYFNTAAPYLTLAVGTILLTPHIDWLIANQFMPFAYAIELHPATFWSATLSALGFIGSSLGYIAAPLAFILIAARPSVTTLRDIVWPREPERRILVVAFAAPFLFAALIAVLMRVKIEALWAISAMTLFPIVALSSPGVTIPRHASVGMLALAIAFPLAMIVVSPIIAIVTYFTGVPNYGNEYRVMAEAIESSWHDHTAAPLRIVGGPDEIVNGMVFYFAKQPATFELFSPAYTPWIDDESIRRDGMALICPQDYAPCGRRFDGYVAHYRPIAIDHVKRARRFFGLEAAPVEYVIAVIPPRAPRRGGEP
jgi:hypothetical protein